MTFIGSTMMSKLKEFLKNTSLARSERGGIVLITLVAFIALALPISVGAAKVSSQLSRSSQTYDELFEESYNAGSAIEYGFSQVLDPAFTDALLPGAPTTLNVKINGEVVALTVTEIPSNRWFYAIDWKVDIFQQLADVLRNA